MKICAIICELNPFHNGHQYIFNKARELAHADYVIALMSGHFCQRGEPAITDAYSRAKIALSCGADLVLELPTIYAVSSADYFAYGSINILNSIPNITHLVMGSESGDSNFINTVAGVQVNESDDFTATLKQHLSDGKSYAKALTLATCHECEKLGYQHDFVANELSKPNNILAVAYKKMMLKTNSKMEFVTANRVSELKSATDIRADFDEKSVQLAMPTASYDITKEEYNLHRVNLDSFALLIRNGLIGNSLAKIASTPECIEGLEHKLKSNAITATSHEKFLQLSSTARYTLSRINRICLHNILGIRKSMMTQNYKISRLLGIRKSAIELLSILPKNIIMNKGDELKVPKKYSHIYDIDIKAYQLYSMITNNTAKRFNQMLIKV